MNFMLLTSKRSVAALFFPWTIQPPLPQTPICYPAILDCFLLKQILFNCILRMHLHASWDVKLYLLKIRFLIYLDILLKPQNYLLMCSKSMSRHIGEGPVQNSKGMTTPNRISVSWTNMCSAKLTDLRKGSSTSEASGSLRQVSYWGIVLGIVLKTLFLNETPQQEWLDPAKQSEFAAFFMPRWGHLAPCWCLFSFELQN